jgi:hypothetical protein
MVSSISVLIPETETEYKTWQTQPIHKNDSGRKKSLLKIEINIQHTNSKFSMKVDQR